MATAKQLVALKKARAAKKKKVPVKKVVSERKKNPIKLFGVEVKTLEGAIGYMSKGGIIDTDFSKAKKYPLFLAEKHANEFFKKHKKYLAHVKVFEFPKR